MARHRLRCQMVAPVGIREAFEVFEDPRNLARITPPWLNFKIITPEPIVMKKDAVFDYKLRWSGLPLRWRTLITAYEPPFYFVDEMLKGPYILWRHKHTFHPGNDGTKIEDDVEYELPFGRMGDTVHRLFVAEQLKDIFRYRQMSLNEIMCGGKARWTEPAVLVP